jgi:hypothetical protein
MGKRSALLTHGDRKNRKSSLTVKEVEFVVRNPEKEISRPQWQALPST